MSSKKKPAPAKAAPVRPDRTLEHVPDAVDLLVADHLRVARLFADFAKLRDTDQDDQMQQLVKQICRELTVHTQVEEELFYPAVRRAIEDDDLMDEALVEQAGAKDLIAQLQSANPEDDLYEAKVTVLGEQIDHHVQEEEKDMFLQARRSEVDLIALGAQMQKRKSELQSGEIAPPPPPPLKAARATQARKVSPPARKKR